MVDVPQDSAARLPTQLTLEEAGATLGGLLKAVARMPGPEVHLDASQLTDCDSSAVAVLLELRRALQAQGKTLKVLEGPERLWALVTLYGVSELLPA